MARAQGPDRVMRTRYALPIIVLAALPAPARAAQITLTDTWQKLGTGPMLISVLGGDGLFEASVSAPTDYGHPVARNQNPVAFNATIPIWGKRRSTAVNPIAITSQNN